MYRGHVSDQEEHPRRRSSRVSCDTISKSAFLNSSSLCLPSAGTSCFTWCHDWYLIWYSSSHSSWCLISWLTACLDILPACELLKWANIEFTLCLIWKGFPHSIFKHCQCLESDPSCNLVPCWVETVVDALHLIEFIIFKKYTPSGSWRLWTPLKPQ